MINLWYRLLLPHPQNRACQPEDPTNHRTVELTLRPATTETYPDLGEKGGVPPNNAKTKLFRQRRTRSERERGVGDRRRTKKVAGKLKLWQWDPPESLQSSCILKPSQPNQNYCFPVRPVTYVVLPYQKIIIHQRIAFRFVLDSSVTVCLTL